jgi:hypothetical protein
MGALTFASTCRPTTLIVVIVPQGMVVGADGKTVAVYPSKKSPSETGSARKLFLIQNRLAIATVGLTKAFNGPTTAYDSNVWIPNVEKELPDNIAVDAFASVIYNESAKAFSGFDVILTSGTMKQQSPLEQCSSLVQFLVAGYKAERPMVFVVDFNIDWQRKTLVGPQKTQMHPVQGAGINFGLYSIGVNAAIKQLNNQDSYAYKQAISICPIETKAILTYKAMTLEQAARFVRVLINIEKEVEPNDVGGDTTVASIPKIGTASVVTYKEELVGTRHGRK